MHKEEEKTSLEISYQAGNKLASKYKPEFDDQIYEHMLSGYSFKSFLTEPQVTEDTLHNWKKNIESFRLAYERGVKKFLKRCETALISEMFGLPLSESQKQWMPKVNHKLLRFVMSKRFRDEYGVEPKFEADSSTGKIMNVTFVEVGRREPTKRDPTTGAPLRPDIETTATEV